MSLSFDSNHKLLPYLIHSCTGDEFITNFCIGSIREDYQDAVTNIFDYARSKGARRVFVGGSFITDSKKPSDFDCVIVFNSADDIPNFIDSSIIGDIEFDILFASEDHPITLDAFINLFQTYINGMKGKPVVEVILADSLEPWQVRFTPDEAQAEVIKKIYTKRTVIERRKSRGVLFSIHGVRTNAYWNSKLAPLASSQGWIFAPFIYDNPVSLLMSPDKRKKAVESFHDYYHEVTTRYEVTGASIIAHSFGTYIIAKYLQNSEYRDFLGCEIDSIVLTGGIVDVNFDWSKYYPNKIGRILNISSPNDHAVRYMPECEGVKKCIMREKDGIFGRIGVDGIKTTQDTSKFIENLKIPVVNHCNVFREETLTGVIMPFINANDGVCRRDFTQHLMAQE